MVHPILVAGAAGRVGGVGSAVVAALLKRGLPVRALIRRDDERAAKLRSSGAEVIVGDLTQPANVTHEGSNCDSSPGKRSSDRGVTTSLTQSLTQSTGPMKRIVLNGFVESS